MFGQVLETNCKIAFVKIRTSIDIYSVLKSVKFLLAFSIYLVYTHYIICNRKAMNRNWSNQKSNPALKTKAGNK